jgi:DNA-binding Xre family transcriptional regulator
MTTVPTVRRRNIIHPDDQRAQELVSADLTLMRRERVGAVEYAEAVGVTLNNLHQLEHQNSGNMSCLVVERRAAPLGLRLALALEGLPEEVEDDLDVMILAHHFRVTAPMDEVVTRAKATAILTAARLNVARVLIGVTSYELADRMGVRQATVSELLRGAGATSRIASFQRISRGLGGRVIPRLIPLNGDANGNAS